MGSEPTFKRAAREPTKLRLALSGPSGSGKTYTALMIAAGLGKRVALIDTEYGSSALYGDLFAFDRCVLESFSPEGYVAAIHVAEHAGYEVIVIDSLSHAWNGRGGTLEQVDEATASGKTSHLAWRDVAPAFNALIEAMMRSRAHIIATLRSKTEVTVDRDDKGKVTTRRVGLAPVQREGLEYEFDVAGDLDLEHRLTLFKSRAPELSGKVIASPGPDLAATLKRWTESGAPSKPAPTSAAAAAVREKVRANIRAAKTKEQLEALVPAIRKLAEGDLRIVRPEYAKRKNELARAVRAATARPVKGPEVAKGGAS